MADRNRTDLDRDANLYDDFIQAHRGVQSRNPFIDRTSKEDYNRRVVEKEESTTLQTMAKIAGLGFAAYALGRTIPKDIWVEALHKMGQYGRRTFGPAIEARNRALADQATLAGVKYSRREAPALGLSQFIEEEANPFMREIHATLTSRNAMDFADNEVRRRLQQKFATSNEGRLMGLTVGDVLELSKSKHFDQFKVMSRRSLKTLQDFRAQADPSGQWFDKLVVDQHLFRAKAGSLPKGMKATDILDTRWASKRALGTAAYNGLGFQIPFVGFKPVDLFAPFFRMAGERKSFVRLGQNQKLAEKVFTPDTGTSFLVNGKAMHFGFGGAKNIAPGRQFKTHAIDAIAKANLGRLGQHPLQRVKHAPGSFVAGLQDLTGIGPAFREEPFAGSALVYRARVKQGLRKGTVEWKPREHLRLMDLPVKQRAILEAASPEKLSEHHLVDNIWKDLKSLPIVERQKAMLGHSTAGDFVVKDTGEKLKNVGRMNLRARRPGPYDYGRYTDNQGVSKHVTETVYEDRLSTKLNLLGHFATGRLNQLIGATMGIGFRPAQGRFGAFWNYMKIAAIGATFNPMSGYLVEAAKYVNYMFERLTGGFGHLGKGVGIDDIAIKGYEGVTLGAAALKDITGITAGSRYMEDLFPGSVESPLSGMARTLGPMFAGMKHGPAGMLAGLGFAALSGGVSDTFGTNVAGAGLTTSASDLLGLYSGEKKERIRQSRWWMLGRQSFYGEGTDRFAPNWVALAKSDYEYTSTLYGSKGEYFSHKSSLPTFHNLFGLGRDRDYFAEKHQLSRPYPEAPSGKQLNAGLMGPSGLQQGPGLGTLAGAGFGSPMLGTYPVGSQTDLSYALAKGFGSSTELLGIYKFFGEMVMGRSDYGPVMANASSITDDSRRYWDKDLGGMFGMTELLRRFILPPNDVGAIEEVNTIPNQMPGFLPGSRSMFMEDRGYFKDFSLGDPYAKIKGGEYRLPGAGYESINELHSGKEGVYDPVDAFMILSDVAPYSKAYQQMKNVVGNMELSDEWRQKVKEAEANREIKVQGISADFSHRRFTGGSQEALRGINDEIRYNAVERFLGKQYEHMTHDALPEVGRMVPFGTLLTHKLFPHHTAEQDYLERQVYNARYSNWHNPYEGFIRPKALTLYNENPLTATVGGAMIGLMGATPGARAVLSTVGAVGFGAASTARGAYYGQVEGGYVPDFRRNEEAVNSYFDKLEYLRLERAQTRATMLGDLKAAKQYKYLQSRRTMVGLDYSNPDALRMSRGALPGGEKPYLNAFANASPQARDRILQMSPQYMRDIYKNIWERGSVELDKNAAMAEFMMNNNVPGDDWAGWNPGVEKWQLMSRTMDTADNSIAVDLHRQNISNAMMSRTRMQLPDVGLDLGGSMDQESHQWHEATNQKLNLEQEIFFNGIENARIGVMPQGSADPYSRQSWKLRRDKRAQVEQAIREAIR